MPPSSISQMSLPMMTPMKEEGSLIVKELRAMAMMMEMTHRWLLMKSLKKISSIFERIISTLKVVDILIKARLITTLRLMIKRTSHLTAVASIIQETCSPRFVHQLRLKD